MSSAHDIKDANWGKDNKPGDFPMAPWHWLVCQPEATSLPAKVSLGLRQLYQIEDEEGETRSPLKDGPMGRHRFTPHDKWPSWAKPVLHGEYSEDEIEAFTDAPSNLAVIQANEEFR